MVVIYIDFGNDIDYGYDIDNNDYDFNYNDNNYLDDNKNDARLFECAVS